RIVTWKNWRQINIFWSNPAQRRTAMISTTPAQERYTRFSCPNPQCPCFNHPGEGNIVHRSWTGKHKHIERLRCTACDREFSEREGTLMARSKLSEDTVEQRLKCQRWGDVMRAPPISVRWISRRCIVSSVSSLGALRAIT